MPADWWLSFQWWNTLSNLFLVLNILLAFSILFFERKRPSSLWAWILLLFFLPVIGFLVYLLFGQPYNKNRDKHPAPYENRRMEQMTSKQLGAMDDDSFDFSSKGTEDFRDIIRMNLRSEAAPLTCNNQLQIFTDGKRKFEALFADIRGAEDHIHLQYYIFKNDEIGNRLVDLLTAKAKQGVKVLILYDDLGSKYLPHGFFSGLLEAGGKTAALLPSRMPFGNLHINYRNHRKIAVIDGETGYIGGFNVGDEYLGKKPKFGYWRDTHLRVEGAAVHSLQHRFLLDWNRTSHKHPVKAADNYFPQSSLAEGVAMQTISSGPDDPNEQIKNALLRLIHHARKSVFLQTPYFIPDNAILEALRTAALSGVDVRIMIPVKPDHPFVHSASLSFLHDLLPAGAKGYLYNNGFLHAKTLTVDGKAFSAGSANMDIRSFSLNYEANAFVYDEEKALEMVRIFHMDEEVSKPLKLEDFEERSLFERFKQRAARLVAPIL